MTITWAEHAQASGTRLIYRLSIVTCHVPNLIASTSVLDAAIHDSELVPFIS